MCEAIGAVVLIDDSLKYAIQTAEHAGIEVILFGKPVPIQSSSVSGGSAGGLERRALDVWIVEPALRGLTSLHDANPAPPQASTHGTAQRTSCPGA
jgi:hypothetical protein